MPEPIVDAVTFDFWDTICQAPPPAESRARRKAEIAEVLRSFTGSAPDEATIDQALVDVLALFNQHWASNLQYTHVEAVAALEEMFGVTFDDDGRSAMASAVTGANSSVVPALTPNVADTLRALKAAGIRIGIICDVGLAPSSILRRHLGHHEVLDLFDHWSFSDEVGWFKPAPEIFDHALAGLGGIDPSRAAHIGDLRRTDIAGAQAMGILAIRYSGITDDPPEGPEPIEADHVVSDHADLPGLLGA